MPQAIVPSPYPQKICCKTDRIGLASAKLLLVPNCVRKLVDWFFLRESAMNGSSDFSEVQSSASRSSTNRFLQDQRHRFGTGAFRLIHTHDLIALSTEINTNGARFQRPLYLYPEMRMGQGSTSTIVDAEPSLLKSESRKEVLTPSPSSVQA